MVAIVKLPNRSKPILKQNSATVEVYTLVKEKNWDSKFLCRKTVFLSVLNKKFHIKFTVNKEKLVLRKLFNDRFQGLFYPHKARIGKSAIALKKASDAFQFLD